MVKWRRWERFKSLVLTILLLLKIAFFLSSGTPENVRFAWPVRWGPRWGTQQTAFAGAGATRAMAFETLEPSSESLDLVFHGAAWNLSLSILRDGRAAPGAGGVGCPEPVLAIDLEELATGATWHAEFAASYIEMLTSKTGSSKRFDVLVKMLRGALFRQSDAVFLDLLTYADLVRGRARLLQRRLFISAPLTPLPPPPPLPAGAAALAKGRLLARARAAGRRREALPHPHLRRGV